MLKYHKGIVMFKKYITLIISCIVVACIFVGCKEQSTNQENTTYGVYYTLEAAFNGGDLTKENLEEIAY